MAELLHEFRRHNADTAYSPDCRRRRQQLHPALPRQRSAAGERRSAAGRRRAASSSATPRTSPALFRSTAASPPRSVPSTRWCSRPTSPPSPSVRPGNHWNEPHEAAVRVITQGLVKLGLLQGSRAGAHQERRLPALLHAPHRPLARAGRARCRRLQGRRRMARARAGHGDDHRAGHLPAGRRPRRAQAFPQHRHPHRGRRGRDPARRRSAHARARRRTPTRSKRSWRAACKA